MLIYEHGRSEELVNKLIRISREIVWLNMVASCVTFAGLGAAFASEQPPIGGVLGLVLGWGVAKSANLVVTSVLEWMAQILIVQGEMLEQLKNKRTP